MSHREVEYWRARFENARQQRNTLLGALGCLELRVVRLEAHAGLRAKDAAVAAALERLSREVLEEAHQPSRRLRQDRTGGRMLQCEACGLHFSRSLGRGRIRRSCSEACAEALQRSPNRCRDCGAHLPPGRDSCLQPCSRRSQGDEDGGREVA